jgi:hypothetical protein
MSRRTAWTYCLTAALACGIATARGAENKEHHHDAKAHHEHEGEHKAAHGGCLNALGACENGHAEVKLESGVLKLWFVGGGADTEKAVRIPDQQIILAVTLNGEKEAKSLTLVAKPNELAEEKPGECSQFEGQADWLKGATQFVATGTVTFKGRKQAVRVEYPKGYDPDED